MKKILSLVLLLFMITMASQGQSYDKLKADSLLRVNGEIYFKFSVFDKAEVTALTSIISIDKVTGNEVYAYANPSGFEKFLKSGYDFAILTPPGSVLKASELVRTFDPSNPSEAATWNFYPTYQQYVDTMVYFQNAYPTICKLDTIGTTNQGRLLLAVKISKDVSTNGAKPQFLYTSSMHGDETTGYVGMLHLITDLLGNYGTDPYTTRLVDSVEIFINPLANPDGTYHGGNSSVNGATRGNAFGIDLNRNYPDPAAGNHPDGNAWQTETISFMNYAYAHGFSMSANFHGGSEVFNYPWDTWAKLTADDSWWQFVGREYADTVHHYGPAGYFNDLQNGITNGYAWYTITGGRQDYMNYWHKCREVTIELSTIKLLPPNQLVNYYNYNYHSYLNYIEQTLYGIHGLVTDTATGQPLRAKITVSNHDKDSSFVYSRLPSGYYDRVIDHGTWELTFSKSGYYSKTISNVTVVNYQGLHLDVQLKPIGYGTGEINQGELTIYPVPASHEIHIVLPETDTKKWKLDVFNALGTELYSTVINNSGKIVSVLDVSSFTDGLYFVVLSNDKGIYRKQIIVRHGS